VVELKNLNQAVSRLVAASRPSQIILFGSQARGDADSRSDVDLLVVCPWRGSRRKLMNQLSRALSGLEMAVDVMVLSPEEFETDKNIPGTLARPVWLEGKVLYEAL